MLAGLQGVAPAPQGQPGLQTCIKADSQSGSAYRVSAPVLTDSSVSFKFFIACIIVGF